jgi:hypothetical protein
MFFHRLDRSRAGVRLGVEIKGCALFRHPPVIKDPRNVSDLFPCHALGAAQNEIVIL